MGEDPVKEGLVTSLNRPTGNITGLTTWTNQLFCKRLQLLLDVAPAAVPLALLVNPTNSNFEPDSRDVRAASAALGRELRVFAEASQLFTKRICGTVRKKTDDRHRWLLRARLDRAGQRAGTAVADPADGAVL
jgi:putative ABC transport system substrate-binding protein